MKFDLIIHHFKLEFVDSSLYFVQDEINLINPLLQVGSRSGSNEKSPGSGSGGPKINGSGFSSLNFSEHLVHINNTLHRKSHYVQRVCHAY